MTTYTTSIDIMGLQAAYANLHTDQERDYFMQRYHDVISSFGGKTSYDADNRPLLVILFFFQAEDGIRDIGVTGVQTCALPIWFSGRFSQGAKQWVSGARPHRSFQSGLQREYSRQPASDRLPQNSVWRLPYQCHGARFNSGWRSRGRSEERRVGKECRSGWVTD